MRRVVLALAALGAATAMAEETAATAETALAPLQSREVIERLKTMRAQLLLEQEYNRLLEARVKRLELEERLGVSADKATSRKDLPKPPPRVTTTPPAQLDNGVKDLVVKSVTVQPFKEAFVIYKGRVYTVRPGDTMGDLSIKDITENGVVTNRATVNME
jgi:hypothetical protein